MVSPSLFILTSSICMSLPCLISTLTQWGKGGHLFRLTYSFVCRETGTPQKNTPDMCGECSQWMDHTGFATAQGGMCFLGLHCSSSRVLCKGTVPSGPWISCTSQVCSGSQVLQKVTDLDRHCFLCPSQVQAAQVTECIASTLSQVDHAFYSSAWSQLLGFQGAP